MSRTVFWTLWERMRVGWFGRMALKHVYYHIWNESPVQVLCMIQDAWGWCTGMPQRDGTGRDMGGGFRMGNTCTPMADSCQCKAKPIQYCKNKIKSEIRKKKKKRVRFPWLASVQEKNMLILESLLISWIYVHHHTRWSRKASPRNDT